MSKQLKTQIATSLLKTNLVCYLLSLYPFGLSLLSLYGIHATFNFYFSFITLSFFLFPSYITLVVIFNPQMALANIRLYSGVVFSSTETPALFTSVGTRFTVIVNTYTSDTVTFFLLLTGTVFNL